MSDEPKRPGLNWLSWAAATVLVLALMPAYLWAHYATSVSVIKPGFCCSIRTRSHEIGGKEVPDWLENYFFWPAYLIENAVPGAQWGSAGH
jgi:hypothetical protein